MFKVSHTVLPASLTLSPDKCDPGGSRPGVPPPEEGERASSFPNPYADNEELGGRWNGEGNCYSISKTVQFVSHICIYMKHEQGEQYVEIIIIKGGLLTKTVSCLYMSHAHT